MCRHAGRGARTGFWAPLVGLAAVAFAACATYTDRLAQTNLATSGGNYEAAITQLNGVLGVRSSAELPASWNGDRPLAVLERGILQQALGRYPAAARDFSGAEQELELLDLRNDAVGTLGSYVYSDSVKAYRTPPTERLALNAINLLNYLAAGDLEGAAVEARRFQVMRDFLASEEIDATAPAAVGTYLSGFTFERRGEGDRALRYYEETLASTPLESLTAPALRLAAANPYRGPRLNELLARAGKQKKESGGAPAELLVVVNAGRVPHKIPERMPIGAAIALAGTAVTGDVDFLRYGVTKVVVYPELVPSPSSLGPPTVRIDANDAPLEQLADLGSAIRHEYEKMKPKIVAAALTRLASRAAVAEGVRVGGSQESKLLGDLLSIATESVLVALDKPDTRSWTMLPDRVYVARVPVPPGPHQVEVDFGAGNRSFNVDLPSQGFSAVVVTEPR